MAAIPDKVSLVQSKDYGSCQTVENGSMHRRPTPSESSSSDDAVEIHANNLVEDAVKQCKVFLTPFYVVIKILGWMQFTKNGDRFPHHVARIVVILFWNVLLLTTFITQILCCFSRDRFNLGVVVNGTNFTERQIVCTDHLVSTFVLLDILVWITYWFGVYLFSSQEREYLTNLAEKMFLKLKANDNSVEKKVVIGTIWAFIIGGLLWIVASFVVRILYAITVHLFDTHTAYHWNHNLVFQDGAKHMLIVWSLFGFFTYDVLYFMAVMNYVVQSEMLFYILLSVTDLVKRKQYQNFDAAIKDVNDVREKLHELNGKTAAATAVVIFVLISNGIFALITMGHINDVNSEYGRYFDERLATATAILNFVLWWLPVVLPLIQAARISYQCNRLRETGFYLRTRPYVYGNTPQADLDSYLIFIHAANLRATIFGIPIHPWMLYAALVIFILVMLILSQTGAYTFPVHTYI